jgi:hypothetical protein
MQYFFYSRLFILEYRDLPIVLRYAFVKHILKGLSHEISPQVLFYPLYLRPSLRESEHFSILGSNSRGFFELRRKRNIKGHCEIF